MTGIKADRRGYRTIFSSLLKYIKNEKFNLNQNQYDFFMKKLEKEDVSLIAIYEVYLHTYDFQEFTENLFIMHQRMGHEEEEIDYGVDQEVIYEQSRILYQFIGSFGSQVIYSKLLDWIKMGDKTVLEFYKKYIKVGPQSGGVKNSKKFVECLNEYANKRIKGEF